MNESPLRGRVYQIDRLSRTPDFVQRALMYIVCSTLILMTSLAEDNYSINAIYVHENTRNKKRR